jgi:NAD(P)-dependent dehydrogenase (short-subunit alcohol dehydrogenase family)
MNPAYDFKDQVALVTGASSGMGLATAKAFAQAGAAVVLADCNEAALRQASEALNAEGHRTIVVTLDVPDEAQAAAMVERTVATFGRLGMADNNAGILGPMGDIDTPMGDSIAPDAMKEFVKGQPIGRMGRSEEVAAAVLWLCSPGASFILGVALPVDGGFVVHRLGVAVLQARGSESRQPHRR